MSQFRLSKYKFINWFGFVECWKTQWKYVWFDTVDSYFLACVDNFRMDYILYRHTIGCSKCKRTFNMKIIANLCLITLFSFYVLFTQTHTRTYTICTWMATNMCVSHTLTLSLFQSLSVCCVSVCMWIDLSKEKHSMFYSHRKFCGVASQSVVLIRRKTIRIFIQHYVCKHIESRVSFGAIQFIVCYSSRGAIKTVQTNSFLHNIFSGVLSLSLSRSYTRSLFHCLL